MKFLLGTILLVGASSVSAGSAKNPLILPADRLGLGIDACFEQAASAYGLPVPLLRALAAVESNFDPSAFNANGGVKGNDLGIMQINSRWLPTLEAQGMAPERIHDPCTNIHVGAWVLRGNIQTYGWTWRAVGAYHASSRREDLREAYVQRVIRALQAEEAS